MSRTTCSSVRVLAVGVEGGDPVFLGCFVGTWPPDALPTPLGGPLFLASTTNPNLAGELLKRKKKEKKRKNIRKPRINTRMTWVGTLDGFLPELANLVWGVGLCQQLLASWVPLWLEGINP